MSFSRQEATVTESPVTGGWGRSNQKIRTRRALIDAAIKLARTGKSPTIAEVAEEALVSVPTAYRYFSSPQQLWLEVSMPAEIRDPELSASLAQVPDDDVAGRLEAIVKVAGWPQFDDEVLWRNVVQATLERWFAQANLPEDQRVPVRGDRRMRWIREALKPLQEQMSEEALQRLTMGIALTLGTEALITLRDVCHLDPEEAKQIELWACLALLKVALVEDRQSRTPSGKVKRAVG
jgi:AcrR family transcriptional regulator